MVFPEEWMTPAATGAPVAGRYPGATSRARGPSLARERTGVTGKGGIAEENKGLRRVSGSATALEAGSGPGPGEMTGRARRAARRRCGFPADPILLPESRATHESSTQRLVGAGRCV